MEPNAIDLNNLPHVLTRAQVRAILRRDRNEIDRMIEAGEIPTIPGKGYARIPTYQFLVQMGLRSDNYDLVKEIQLLRKEIAELKDGRA